MMRTRILRWKFWILGVILALALFGTQVGKSTRIYTRNSSFSTGKYGGKVYYLLLKKLGYRVIPCEEPLKSLESKRCVVAILSPFFNYDDQEVESLRTWVYSGGTLLCADDDDNEVYSGFEIIPYQVTHADKPTEVVPIPSKVTENVNKVLISTSTRLKFGSDYKKEILLVDEKGVIMVIISYGKGKVISASCPEVFTNEMIQKADNGILAANCVYQPPCDVYFDEFHHGHARQVTLYGALDKPFRLFIIQMIGAALFILHRMGKRFQNPLSSGEEKNRGSVEFVKMMANLFERAQARTYVLSMLFQNFKRKVALKLGVPIDAEAGLLIKSIVDKMKMDESKVSDVFSECEESLKMKNLRDKKMLDLARAMDTLGKGEIYGGK